MGFVLMLTIGFIGRLSLKDVDGVEYTPPGIKAKGLIALLAMSPEFRRSRSWLQSKLWSDREEAQASGSLRRTLSEIRKALGPHRDALRSSGGFIWLDPIQIRFNTDASFVESNKATRQNLLEDLDKIRDREFEHVLRDIRQHLIQEQIKKIPPKMASKLQPIVIISQVFCSNITANTAISVLKDRISRMLKEEEIRVLDGNSTSPAFAAEKTICIEVRLRSFSNGGFPSTYVSADLINPETREVSWSNGEFIKAEIHELEDDLPLGRFCINLFEEIGKAIVDWGELNGFQMAALLNRCALSNLFEMDWNKLQSSDELFSNAYELAPSGVTLAWRAFLRNIALFQHRRRDFTQSAEISDLSSKAMKMSSDSFTVRAINSQLEYIHEGDTGKSLYLSQLSAEAARANPLSWATYSNSLTVNNRPKDAYDAALRSVALSSGSRSNFFFEHFACMAAAALGEYEKALTHASNSLAMKPEFVSTRRYQVALAIQIGEEALAKNAIQALRKQEANFHPHDFLDPNYPTTTLRRLPLIDAIK